MALFTGKGDNGTTKIFGNCPQRLSKDSPIIEALGELDELNSFLGICKNKVSELNMIKFDPKKIIHQIQENLFIVQAEVAGADKSIVQQKVDDLSELINEIEKELPEIKSFFIPGASEISSHLDYARTLARRAERGVLKAKAEVSDATKAYLNRLSSILYALVRLSNHEQGQEEKPPSYE